MEKHENERECRGSDEWKVDRKSVTSGSSGDFSTRGGLPYQAGVLAGLLILFSLQLLPVPAGAKGSISGAAGGETENIADPVKKRVCVDPEAGAWMELFNGRNLDGWIPKVRGYELHENPYRTFRVEDGLLKVRYDGYDRFDERYGHLFYEKPFSRYRLQVEYRFTGEQPEGSPQWAFRNSGIMFHSQPPETMGRDQDFPISIEFQMLGGNGVDERSTANLCTPGTNVVMNGELQTTHCIPSSSKTYHGDRWVQAELVVYGDSLVQHLMEGEVVLEYSRPQIGGGVVNGYLPQVKEDGKILESGYIAIQSESHPLDIRSVRLLDLSDCGGN